MTEKSPAAEAGLKKDDIVIAVNGKTILSYDALTKAIDAGQVGDTIKLTVARDRKAIQVQLKLGKKPKPKQPPQRRQSAPMTPQEQALPAANSHKVSADNKRIRFKDPQDINSEGSTIPKMVAKRGHVSIASILRPMYYSQIRVDPTNNKNIWVLGTQLYLSKDGGVTFTSENTARGIHVDHHSLWIDPHNGRHLLLGNDGGIHVTYDQGLNWDHLNFVAIGQFYHVAIGPRRNYSVYGGLQDNGSWACAPARRQWTRSHQRRLDFDRGGDGFVCAVDPDDPDLIYSESQLGAISRINLRTGERGFATAQRARSAIPLQLEDAVHSLTSQPKDLLQCRQPSLPVAL